MKTESLKKFTNTSYPEVYTIDGQYVATDGHIIVLTNAPGDADACPLPGKIKTYFLSLREEALKNPPTGAFPATPQKTIQTECRDCRRKMCDDCDGAGSTTCSECGQDVKCDTCDGEGYLPDHVCPKCGGGGMTEYPESVFIDGQKFDGRYIQIINEALSDVKCNVRTFDESAVLFFTGKMEGDEAWGVLMPLRW